MAFELDDFVYRLMTSPELLDNTQLLVINFGLLGIFVVSALGSSILIPMPVDLIILFSFFLTINPLLVILVASLGNVLGNSFDYYVGLKSSKFVLKSKWSKWLRKFRAIRKSYNTIVIFVGAAVPLPTNLTSLYAGAIKYDFNDFLKLNFLGRIIRYSAFFIVIRLFYKPLELFLFQKYQLRVSIALVVIFLIGIVIFSRITKKHRHVEKKKQIKKKKR